MINDPNSSAEDGSDGRDASVPQPRPVGYKVAPPDRQYGQPGGNRPGRRKGKKNTKTAFAEMLAEPVPITINGKKRRVPIDSAILIVSAQKALKGDMKAIAFIMNLAERFGLTDSTDDKAPVGEDEAAIIEAAIRRRTES